MTEETKTTQVTTEAKFTEEQVQAKIDSAVESRLSRERKSIATKLGIESYDKLDGFLEGNKSSETVRTTLQTENTGLKEQLTSKDETIDMLSVDIDPAQFDNARALTKVQIEKDDTLDFKASVAKLVETMPFLKKSVEHPTDSQKTKVGVEVKTTTDTRTEEEKYLEKYKGSRYYKR
jgi:hypothetical protein